MLVSLLGLAANWSVASTASDTYQLQRNMELKTSLADAMSDAHFAQQLGLKVLVGMKDPDSISAEHAWEIGQEFETAAAHAENSLSSVAFVTSHHTFSASLLATRERLETARTATAVFFSSSEPPGVVREAFFDHGIKAWADMIDALNEVRAVAYCELMIKGEEPGGKRCPITPSIRPTNPTG